jgi:tetratricopeptide (TPR) repeat protein
LKTQGAQFHPLGNWFGKLIRHAPHSQRRLNSLELKMRPLTPQDLLIRQNPVAANDWGPGDGDSAANSGPVSLQRFQELEMVLRNSPLSAEPYLELARIYLQSQRWVDAKRVLDRAFQQFPELEEVISLREDAQLARSLELHSQSEAAHAAEPTMLTEEALQRSTVELNALRERVCRSRLARHPEQTELYIPLANALEKLGNAEEAISCLSRAVEVPELRAAAALQLGYVYMRGKRIPEALSAFRRAALFRIPPPPEATKREALSAAADLAERHNMVDSARRYVELLLEMSPTDDHLKRRLDDLKSRPL